MPNTYKIISSNILSTDTSTVVFDSIPTTFTDLSLICSVRDNSSSEFGALKVTFNSNTSSFYYRVLIFQVGGNTIQVAENTTGISGLTLARHTTGNTAVGNVFSNTEIYIPGYTNSTYHPISSFGAGENNSESAGLAFGAGEWQQNAAINSITLDSNGSTFKSGSSFYLYGISNA